MDVRCPNCQTEYELDEGRLRPGGVTVKCASCQHVFRVRKRADTNPGVVSPAAAKLTARGEDEERSWLIRIQDGEIKVCRELATLQRWIVSGNVTKDCEISRTGKKWKPLSELKELASFFAIAEEARDVAAGRRASPLAPAPAVDGPVILHQVPIQSRPHTVPRDSVRAADGLAQVSGIYREQETVQLSEAAAQEPYAATEQDTVEMSSEEAHAAIEAARLGYNMADPPTPPVAVDSVLQDSLSADRVLPDSVSADRVLPDSVSQDRALEPRSTMHASSPPPARSEASRPGVSSSPPRAREATAPPPAPGSRARSESGLSAWPRPRGKTQSPPIPARDSAAPVVDASWAKEGKPRALTGDSSGPTGGFAKGVPTADAAFARSSIAPEKVNSGEFKDGRFVAVDQREPNILDTMAPLPASESGIGKWIVLLSLLVLGAAGVALYVVFSNDGTKNSSEIAHVAVDASIEAPIHVDVDDEPDPGPEASEVLGALDDAIRRYDFSVLDGLASQLEASEEGLDRSLGLARLYNVQAQLARDKATIAPGDAKALMREAKRLGSAALKSADAALDADAKNGAALLAKADAQRLSGLPTREVERVLKSVGSDSSLVSESEYVSGMLRVRDQRISDARKLFDGLLERDSSVRVKYRVAMLDLAEGKLDEARSTVQTILGVNAAHTQAQELLAWIDSKIADRDADASGATASGVNSEGNASSSGSTGKTNTGSGDSYDRILSRADTLAETGKCGQAITLYERALNDNPSGVEALTGLGYCHLDAKNFASAQARFRAALGISSRYQDALWGVAEGYQQQGLTEQAIAGYQKFIDEHPTSRRAEMAKRQIERLGGKVGGSDSGSEPDTTPSDSEAIVPEATPKVPTAPTPTPTPSLDDIDSEDE